MKRGLGWPIGMAVILALTVAANIGVIVVANDDPSFAVEPDYYRKAVHWDDAMAQERTNVALGWTLVPTLAPLSADAPARLVVRLADGGGLPVAGATLRVRAMHNARAAEVFEATLQPTAVEGAYEAEMPLRRPGQWELRFEATREGQHFTTRARVEATLASGTGGGARGAGM